MIDRISNAAVVMAGVLAVVLTACGSNGKRADGDGKLVFQIWDSGQKAGMEKLTEAYMEDHPEAKIEVQATGWDEYWTKLEASATSNSIRVKVC